MIASLQRQIASLEGVINTLRRELAESQGEPAPTRPRVAAAAPAASTTAAAKAKAAMTTVSAAADKAAAPTSRAATTWRLAGQNHTRHSKNARAKQAAAAPRGSPPRTPVPVRVCVWTGIGSGQRNLEHRDGCLYQSGHLPVHPFASSQPYRAQEDIKMARGNINLWGVGGVAEVSTPPPPQQAGPGGATYASATRSAARGSRPGAVRVVAAAGRTKATLPPIQPTAAALGALLPSTTAVQPLRLYQGESWDTIREVGIAQITLGQHPAEWKQPSQEGALRCVALVGCTVHEAHLAAAAALTAHDGVQRVTALVHVWGGQQSSPHGGDPAAGSPPLEDQSCGAGHVPAGRGSDRAPTLGGQPGGGGPRSAGACSATRLGAPPGG